MGTVIVTMAGECRRFAEAGIDTPKWALKVGGRSVLARAFDSVAELLDDGWRLTLVVRSDPDIMRHLRRCVAESGRTAHLVTVNYLPNGQARTAVVATPGCDPEQPVVVWCADTVILPGPEPVAGTGNWLTVAELPGDQWSFAAVGRDHGEVCRTAEKERISRYASVGLYGFATPRLLERAVIAAGCQELYVAPLYNHLIAAGHPVRPVHLPADRVAVFGTPAQLIDSCTRLGWSLPDEIADLPVTAWL